MVRIIAFLVVIAAVAVGVAWVADQTGSVSLSWSIWQIETSLPVFIFGLAALFIVAMAIWSAVRGAWRTPERLRRMRHERRHKRGRDAVTRGLIAVGTGDHLAARRHAGIAKRLAHQDPLALLLHAQTAQLDGDRDGAQRAFRAMAEREDTRLLGLRGLFIEAQRNDDPYTAVAMAEEALKIAPGSAWASHAALGFRCAKGDWDGALKILENNLAAGLIDPAPYKRQRGVLLTARALELEHKNRDASRGSAMEAVKLAPTLVPAAVLAAKFLSEDNQTRRAMRVIEAAWAVHPHPDLADAYAHVRLGDSALERLARVESLAQKMPGHPESALALARAAMDAGEFARARTALAPLLDAPTQRVAMLMAELERAEHGDDGRARSWMLRAARAAHDPVWTADGYVSDHWRPVSPVTGRLDAFQWITPVAALPSDKSLAIEPAGDELVAAIPETVPSSPEPAPLPAPQDNSPAAPVVPESAVVTDEPAVTAPAPSVRAPAMPPPMFRPRPAQEKSAAPAVIPIVRAPDDPGVDEMTELLDPERPDQAQPGGWRGFWSRLVG
ncbi:heme biosynthesis protein HemY [Afipia sp. Root123D2]|uniref:heme biosynthesis protein HemY n=1 Tax=Afipia sp. Root123D2 TaxID=1736436 RepID=UPI000700B43A|nr:heme biosynthesis HemY N-terminal domain-containing protein [Afipia sp. Root123D2]KQW19481.1 heme biosynthesis protein HemY [Afipia sp. Root123D2]